MTTIACDGKSMVSDGLTSCGDTIIETAQEKIHVLDDGRLIGFCGNTYNFNEVVDYFNGHIETWPTLHGDFNALLLENNGDLFVVDSHGRLLDRSTPAAIGSGWKFAMTALHCGKSAREAVEIACEFDVFSGGTIQQFDL